MFHCYADDTRVYVSVTPEQHAVDAAIQRLVRCIDDIHLWMSNNYLKFNDDKSEFIVIGSKQQRAKVSIPHIRVGDANILPSKGVRNLGVIFDSCMSMDGHVTHIVRSANFSLRNIGLIRKHLSRDVAELLVHAYITSILDIGNSLYGISRSKTDRLQRLQNKAARIITLTKCRAHISPVLSALHWLRLDRGQCTKLVCLSIK